MTKKSIIFIIAVILLSNLSVLNLSCKKDTDIILTADKTNVTPFEVITITTTDYIFTEEKYSALIADRNIKLIKDESNKLIFMMPSISGGNQILSFSIDGVEQNINFTITALEVVDNPSEVINNYKENIDNALDTIANLNILSGIQISEQNIQIIENYISDFEQAFTTASEAEKQELAQFMQANSEMFDFNNFDFQLLRDSLNIETKDFAKWDKKLTQDIQYFTGLVIATGATIAIFNGTLLSGNPILIAIAGAALCTEFILVYNQTETILTRSYKPFQFNIWNELENSKENEFNNNETYQINIEATYRSLYNKDNGSSSSINSLASSMNTFAGYWNTIANYIPGLDGTVPTLETQSSYLTNPNTSSISSEYITIGNITNPNVTIDNFSNTSGVSVSFTTNETEEQNFTFDIVYTNPNFSTKTETISASIIGTPLFYGSTFLQGTQTVNECQFMRKYNCSITIDLEISNGQINEGTYLYHHQFSHQILSGENCTPASSSNWTYSNPLIINGNNVSFTISIQNGNVHFSGIKSGSSISGTFTVSTTYLDAGSISSSMTLNLQDGRKMISRSDCENIEIIKEYN